jgi:hypothetical protein
VNNQACSSNNRLSKKTFISLLGNKAFKKPLEYSSTEDYVIKGQKIKIASNEEFSRNKTRQYFEKLDYNSWSITSFDPKTRKVCIKINIKSGDRFLSVTVPEVISK